MTQIDFFQAKSLSYNIKLLLGLLLVQFQKIWWNRFYANSKKLWFWAKMAIFQHIWPKSAKMRNFIKNRAVLFFYPYCPPTSCQVSEKSLERFPRSIRYARTYEHTDKGDIIEPVAFAGSTNIDLKHIKNYPSHAYFFSKSILAMLIKSMLIKRNTCTFATCT